MISVEDRADPTNPSGGPDGAAGRGNDQFGSIIINMFQEYLVDGIFHALRYSICII